MSTIALTRLVCRSLSTQFRNRRTRDMLDRIIRVDHAGELAADRIYAGQYAVLSKTPTGPLIKEMWEEEIYHRETFEKLMIKHRARPTAMLPIWNVAGFALGAGTAMLGKEAAMACTVAVEEVIGEHYNNQIRKLVEDDTEKHKEILDIIKQFRDDELRHYETGLEHDAEQAPMYKALTETIKIGCRGAIWLSERI